MILFMINKNAPDLESSQIPPRYEIPFYSEEEINESNIQLISWNEANYDLLESRTKIRIRGVNDLKTAVFDAAKKDSLCQDINRQFFSQYGINIFDIYNNTADENYKIIGGVFSSWPHPMIGNVLVSAGIRPQTRDEQYVKNWFSFPEKYMSKETKEAINNMIKTPETAGLEVLTKSGRDQVRICRDMTELARAMMGEISTYAAKKLEKIYALEFCSSAKLLEAQKGLISKIISVTFYNVTLKNKVIEVNISTADLKELFMAQRKYLKKAPLSVTEYIYFFFPKLSNLLNDEMQWTAFVHLINWTLETESPLAYNRPDERTTILLEECRKEFIKFPPVIRCAMIINGIKKLETNVFIQRYSMSVPSDFEFEGEHEFTLKCELTEASGRDFIPVLENNRLLWNWTREEKHPATMTYRHYLMPLWAGPSGHAAGIIEFYTRHLSGNGIIVKGEWISIISIILPTMFTFWRLYYDKRICAVHTLAETYEAGYSFGLHKNEKISSANKSFVESYISYEEPYITNPELPAYNDPFDTIRFYPPNIKNTYGLSNSVRIMAQIKKKHYTCGISGLNQKIEDLRTQLSAEFAIPQWSKPLIISTENSLAEIQTNYDKVFAGLVIRSFSNLNVRTFEASKVMNTLSDSEPSERLTRLYKNISAAVEGYNFLKDFSHLQECVVDTKIKPFLSAVTFFSVKDCKLENSELTFTGSAATDADFWNNVKPMVSVKSKEEFFCRITDDKNGFNFMGEISVNAPFKISDRLSLNMKSLAVKSGLDENSGFPEISVLSNLTNGEEELDLIVTIPFGIRSIYINGEYKNGKIFTIAKLLALLGLDDSIPISSILPDEERVFGSLGLRDISITVSSDILTVSHIDFTITAEKPWNIFEDKITLTPYFEINIEFPFESRKRKIDYVVLGKWTLGKTGFELAYYSDKRITLEQEENSILNFAEAAELFAKNVKFPEIKFTDMKMVIDTANGDYSLSLAAADVFKIQAGGTKLEIDELLFSLDFENGKFGDLALEGTMTLGGFSLQLNGKYSADDGFAFKAKSISDTDYSLKDFALQIAKDIAGDFSPESFPENFLTANIRTFCVSYESKNSAFLACVDLEHVLEITDKFSIDEIALKISCSHDASAEFEIIACVHICETAVSFVLSKENDEFKMSGNADFKNLTFKNIAETVGIQAEHLPDFIMEFEVKKLELEYNVTKKDFKVTVVSSAGTVSSEIAFGTKSEWSISYKASPSASVDMLNMPLIGETLKKVSMDSSDFTIKDFEIDVSSVHGAVFRCMAFGKNCVIDIYKPDSPPQTYLITNKASNSNSAGTVKWIQINKTFAALTIPKIGIGLDKSKAVVLLDASLNASPFSFALTEAGVGINISNPSEIAFYLSGFGVIFDNGTLSIGGSFSRTKREEKDVYAGALLIKFKTITASAIGEYSSGSLMAYFALSASIGGPPAFFVTGLSLGFGYNKKLLLPNVEAVPSYPLIAAAKSSFNAQILADFNKYIKDENNQNFLTAGVKFTSFKIVNGFLLLSVSFGKEFEIGVLGIADVSVPPNVPTNPIAKAQLALKAAFIPAAGIFSVEARLTSESYILCHDCRLTGGFAAYVWFGSSKYSGDFVITLGGYHPAFKKPEHYPIVPRLALNWNISSHLNISGEIYFALTPSTIMAGGKLSAVYTQGNLKAWFIAYADFLISWKPFSYDISIGVSIGASYRIDWWFIHKTFSIELAAQLHLWGPEIQGKVRISWFIISFTISFSKGQDNSKKSLDWTEFKNSFLLDSQSRAANHINGNSDILTVTLEGVIGKALDGTDIVSPNELVITASSKIPESGNVRPVNNAELKAKIELNVNKSDGSDANQYFTKSLVTQNVPAAMWKQAPAPSDKLKEERIVKDAVCGASLKLNNVKIPELFPKSRYISLDELYKNNTLLFGGCFLFIADTRLELSDTDSIRIFTENSNSEDTVKRRQKFLADNGITEKAAMPVLAANAENWFSEDILIGN